MGHGQHVDISNPLAKRKRHLPGGTIAFAGRDLARIDVTGGYEHVIAIEYGIVRKIEVIRP